MMSVAFRVAVLALPLALSAGFADSASAQAVHIDTYCAFISEMDKQASDGFRLTDAASIIRQDRANFHRFGRADPDDEPDIVFGSVSERERIPTLVERGDIDPAIARAIVQGNPTICVQIVDGAMFVSMDGVAAPERSVENERYPFVGTWDCGVETFVFTPTTYFNGLETLPILEIQEGTDGADTLFMPDDYFITLLVHARGDEMSWLSGASGDGFECRRID